MAADISVKLAVEGEKTFKTAVKAADSQIKALDAELKAAVSGFDDMTSAEDKAAKKSDILTKQIEAQKSKLDLLTKQHDKATAKLEELADALEKAKQEHGEDSAEAQKAANAYNRQVTEVSNLERQMNQTNDAINKETSDLKKLESGVDDVSDEMGEASTETSRFGDVLKANLTGTAIIDAAKKLGETISKLAMDVASYGDEVGDNAAKMGISTKAYQEWDAILQRNGSSIDAMKTSMKTLSSAAQTGKDAFEKLGISQKELSELSTEDLFARTVEGLQNMEQGTERTYIASQLLGKGAQELGSVLDMTADETDDLRKQIRDLGGIMDEKAIKASDEFMDSTQNLKDAFSGLARDVMSDALPVMTNLVTALTNGITKFKEFRNLGKSSNASGLKDLIANVAEWNAKLREYDELVDQLGWEGAQAQIMEYTRAVGNAEEQLLDYVATEEGQLEVLNLLQSGEMTMQEVMDATGWSYSQVIGYMRDAATAQRDAAAATDENTAELSEEEIAAQELTDKLQGLVKETSFAAKGNGDLREEYERLKAEIDACADVEDEHLQELARIALETLNLNATNQELSKSYPGIVNAANRAGISLQSLSKYIIDNGLTADQWAQKCQTATSGVINSFQETKTSLGLSLDEMRANLEHNIEAQQNWNENIATLMAAAAESGNEGAVAFVQYMQDLGVGAADEVAKMVEDIDGTLDTFGPLFEQAADAGMTSVIQGIEGQKIEVTGSFTGLITDGVDAMTEEAGTAEAAGQTVAQSAKTGASSVDFTPVGTQMDAGIVQGIYQNEGSVKTAMTLVARRALASAKAELQIKSPSRVFRDQVGKMVTEGIAVGMVEPDALKTIDESSEMLKDAITDALAAMPYDENVMSAEEWARATEDATNDVINSFKRVTVSIGMSTDEMKSNLRYNIAAYTAWEKNIDTLMDAAVERGDEGAIKFVQYMKDMGIGAADQVAEMVEDIDGTFDEFAPLFVKAGKVGLKAVVQGVEAERMGLEDAIADVLEGAVSNAVTTLATSAMNGIGSSAYEIVATQAETPASSDDVYRAVGGAVTGLTSSGTPIYIPIKLVIDGRTVAENTFDDFVQYSNANGTPIVNVS